MDDQEPFFESLSSTQSQQPQQQPPTTQHSNYPWLPPQNTQPHTQAQIQHAQNPWGSNQPALQPAHPIPIPTMPNGLPPPHLQAYPQPIFPAAHPPPQTPYNLPAAQPQQTIPSAAQPSWASYPIHPRSRIPRRADKKPNWLAFVDTLPWLVNNEIAKENRKCPFCWGEFGMDLVYDEDLVGGDSTSEDGQPEAASLSAWADIAAQFQAAAGGASTPHPSAQVLQQAIAPTLNAAMAGLHVTNPDAESGAEDADDEEDVQPAPDQVQRSMVRQLRWGLVLEAEEKLGKKHYAVELPCGHLYGHMCLVRMLESGEKTCPKCRKDIVS